MKIIITESQLSRITNEYFDPIYFLKNKFKKETKSLKDPNWVPHEEEFQKIVDLVFKMTKKTMISLPHLKGYKVLKVTPQADSWVVLLRPLVDEWFNWSENRKYITALDEFEQNFREFVSLTGISSPYTEGYFPSNIEFVFSKV